MFAARVRIRICRARVTNSAGHRRGGDQSNPRHQRRRYQPEGRLLRAEWQTFGDFHFQRTTAASANREKTATSASDAVGNVTEWPRIELN